jgi:hypothetical protein
MAKNPKQTYKLSPQLFFWLPSLYIVLHTLEELPGFGAWATAHFGTHTTFVFAVTHIPIFLLVFLASYKASQVGRHGGWLVFLTAWQIQFAINAVFHLTTAALFWEYSPGMVVAGSLGFVMTYYVVGRMVREQRLTRKELAWAVLWGGVMATIGIGTLFLG